MSTLHLLSGGAAQGLVAALEDRFQRETGTRVEGTFGAVGAIRERMLAGEPCDVAILTQPIIDALAAQNRVIAQSARPIGSVATGVAVKTGAGQPAVDSPSAVKAALLAATAIYFPDPVKATAGIHFMKVLESLGIAAEVEARLRPFPNGATAMRNMAESADTGSIGCTQVTEILATPGVELVGPLPDPLGLRTVYTAAVTTTARSPVAEAFVRLLVDASTADARRAAGFE